MVVGWEQWGGGGNFPTKKFKSFKITTYKSVYSNKLKGAFTNQINLAACRNCYLSHLILLTVRAPGSICESPLNWLISNWILEITDILMYKIISF